MGARRLLFCLLFFIFMGGALYASPGHLGDTKSLSVKEYIELSVAPMKESVNRLWQVVLGGIALLLTVMLYLHGSTRAEMRSLKTEMQGLKTDIDKRFAEQKTDTDKRFAEQKTDIDKRFAEQKTDIDKRFAEQKTDTDKRFAEQKVDIDKRFDKIESLLQKG